MTTRLPVSPNNVTANCMARAVDLIRPRIQATEPQNVVFSVGTQIVSVAGRGSSGQLPRTGHSPDTCAPSPTCSPNCKATSYRRGSKPPPLPTCPASSDSPSTSNGVL